MCYCSYVDGDECPEELVIHFTVAQWSSNTVRDTVARFGARIIEVSRHSDSEHLAHGYMAQSVLQVQKVLSEGS